MTDIAESPYKKALDGPSRQLLWELGRLQLNDRSQFYTRLERDSKQRESRHKAALDVAAANHTRVRKDAEAERELLERQMRREQEEVERRELERARMEAEAHEKRIKEAEARQLAEKRECDRKQALDAEQRRRAEEAAQEKSRKEHEVTQRAEASRRETEAKRLAETQESDRNAVQAAEEAERKSKEAALASVRKQPVTTQSRPNAISGNPRTDTEHQSYLKIHRNLKQLRGFLVGEAKKNKDLKTFMGDARRAIRKCVGQLTGGVGANKKPLAEVVSTLRGALKFTHPQVDVTMFLANPPQGVTDTQGPALLLYLLNIFAKAVISQFISEAGVSPKAAEPVGVIASSIFAQADLRWNGIALIDILIAKYHVVCPVLFGIYGSEDTNEGKRRLGWGRENKTGPWVSEQRHVDRMTGLGAGYAALTLRNFDRSRLENPYPPSNFWKALAALTNVQPAQVTSTHFTVIKSLLENNEQRILDFFGDAGIVALKNALIEFPQRMGANSVASKSVALLPDVLRRDKKLYL